MLEVRSRRFFSMTSAVTPRSRRSRILPVNMEVSSRPRSRHWGARPQPVGVTLSSARAHLPAQVLLVIRSGGLSPAGSFHGYDPASSRCGHTSSTLSSRDQYAPLTFRRNFLSDSEMNLKWTVKRFLLMSFSISHLLLLEGEFDSFTFIQKCYDILTIKLLMNVNYNKQQTGLWKGQ